jgi:hypothetical protein
MSTSSGTPPPAPDRERLDRLGRKHDTDKSRGQHRYTDFYSNYLARYEAVALSFLEVGVFRGASLRMWDEYFSHPEARLFAVDIKRKHLKNVPDSPRWRSFEGDQSDRAFMREVRERTGPLDVVIEDGHHLPSHQIACFEALWPGLKSGGLYIIEDIHTSYEPGFIERYAPDGSSPASIMPYLNEMMDELVPASRPDDCDKAFIHFYPHVVLIGKR